MHYPRCPAALGCLRRCDALLRPLNGNDDRGDSDPLVSAETNCLSCLLALLVLFKPVDDLVCQGGIYLLLLCSLTLAPPLGGDLTLFPPP